MRPGRFSHPGEACGLAKETSRQRFNTEGVRANGKGPVGLRVCAGCVGAVVMGALERGVVVIRGKAEGRARGGGSEGWVRADLRRSHVWAAAAPHNECENDRGDECENEQADENPLA